MGSKEDIQPTVNNNGHYNQQYNTNDLYLNGMQSQNQFQHFYQQWQRNLYSHPQYHQITNTHQAGTVNTTNQIEPTTPRNPNIDRASFYHTNIDLSSKPNEILLEASDTEEQIDKEEGYIEVRSKKHKSNEKIINKEEIPTKKPHIRVQPKYITKFECTDYEKYIKNYQDVYREIYKYKSNAHVARAYVDPNTKLLVIFTETKKDEQIISEQWPELAFGGLKIKQLESKHVGAIKRVPLSVDIETPEFKNLLKENCIIKAIRVSNKDKKSTTTIKIFVENEEKLNNLVTSGILNDYRKYRVDYWDLRVLVCFKCQKHGHKYEECKKDLTCARCGEGHNTNNCPKTKTYCANCKSDNHGAWSNNCPAKIQAQIILNPYYAKVEKQKQNKKQEFDIWKNRLPIEQDKPKLITKPTNKSFETNEELKQLIRTILAETISQTSTQIPKVSEVEELKKIILKNDQDCNKKIDQLKDKFNRDMDEMKHSLETTILEKEKQIQDLMSKLHEVTKSKDKVQKALDLEIKKKQPQAEFQMQTRQSRIRSPSKTAKATAVPSNTNEEK
jgi:hypothetical protein